MQTLLKKANSIELKIKQFLAKFEMLQKENAFLKEENKNLVEKLKQQKGIIKELEIKFNHIEPIAPGKLEEAKKEVIRKEIDTHIEEIDQVIDILKTY